MKSQVKTLIEIRLREIRRLIRVLGDKPWQYSVDQYLVLLTELSKEVDKLSLEIFRIEYAKQLSLTESEEENATV